jgi:hypothetical protein
MTMNNKNVVQHNLFQIYQIQVFHVLMFENPEKSDINY